MQNLYLKETDGLTLTCQTFVSKDEDCREMPAEVHVGAYICVKFTSSKVYINFVWSDMNKKLIL